MFWVYVPDFPSTVTLLSTTSIDPPRQALPRRDEHLSISTVHGSAWQAAGRRSAVAVFLFPRHGSGGAPPPGHALAGRGGGALPSASSTTNIHPPPLPPPPLLIAPSWPTLSPGRLFCAATMRDVGGRVCPLTLVSSPRYRRLPSGGGRRPSVLPFSAPRTWPWGIGGRPVRWRQKGEQTPTPPRRRPPAQRSGALARDDAIVATVVVAAFAAAGPPAANGGGYARSRGHDGGAVGPPSPPPTPPPSHPKPPSPPLLCRVEDRDARRPRPCSVAEWAVIDVRRAWWSPCGTTRGRGRVGGSGHETATGGGPGHGGRQR